MRKDSSRGKKNVVKEQEQEDDGEDSEDPKLSKWQKRAHESAINSQHVGAQNRINNTKLIKFSFGKICAAYWLSIFTCCVSKGSNEERLMRTYNRGSARFKKQLDLRKILLRLRALKIMQKALI